MGETSDPDSVTYTTDTLWLFSLVEVFGRVDADAAGSSGTSDVYNAEGEQYQFYAQGGVSTDNYALAQKSGVDTWWWLRSPTNGTPSSFRDVRANGGPVSSNAYYAFGVCPGFCF